MKENVKNFINIYTEKFLFTINSTAEKSKGLFFEFNITFKNSNITFKNNVLLDAPFYKQFLFQDPGTDVMEYMIEFHHDITFIMFLFFILVL